MEVRITPTPEQEAFIREAIASGRFQTAEDAAREALRQWEERERCRTELMVELDAAETSLARGAGRRFPVGDYVVVYRVAEDDEVLILRIIRGSRDIPALFGE